MSMTSTPKSMMDSEFGYEIEYIDNDEEEEKNIVDYEPNNKHFRNSSR